MSRGYLLTRMTLLLKMVIYFIVFFQFLSMLFLFSVLNKNIRINGTNYSLKIVDTAGQDEYSIFPHAYAMDIHGYCLVYRYFKVFFDDIFKMLDYFETA